MKIYLLAFGPKLTISVCHHHSYLGNGLYAARLATLGALGAEGRVSRTFYCLLCLHHFNKCSRWKMTNGFFFAFPGLDWKIFTSSCLPKKFREDVTFGGTTYKVSGIPDGKIKALWGFHCLPRASVPAIRAFLSRLWNTIEYSTIHSHTRTFSRCSFCNLGAKRMFCHSLSLSLSPSSSLLNNYIAGNLVFKQEKTVS